MRVVVDATTLDGGPSGAATRLAALGHEHRRSARHEVVHLVRPGVAPLPELDCAPWEGAAGPLGRLVGGRRLDAELRRRGAEVYMAAALPLPRLGACPVVLTVHDLRFLDREADQGRGRRLWGRLGLTRNLERATALVAVSRTTAGRLVDEVGVPAEKVHVVPNGPTPGLGGDPDLDAVAGFRRKADVNRRYVLGIGALAPHKGWLAALEGLADLTRRPGCDDVGLVLAGRARPGPALQLARAAERLGLVDRLRIVGQLSAGELRAALVGAEALVSPGGSEGFAIPVVDAQRLGVPVVAVAGGAHAEVVGEGGWLVQRGRPEALADALVQVLAGGEAVEQRRELGRERAASWSWEASVGVLEALWESLGQK